MGGRSLKKPALAMMLIVRLAGAQRKMRSVIYGREAMDSFPWWPDRIVQPVMVMAQACGSRRARNPAQLRPRPMIRDVEVSLD